MVDGDDGGYLLTAATAPPTQTGGTGAYDIDFSDAVPGNKKVQCDPVPFHAGCSGSLRASRQGRQALLRPSAVMLAAAFGLAMTGMSARA